MPRGAQTFNKHQAAVEQNRAEQQAAFGPKADYFGLQSGQIAVVRFLEQGPEISWASMHRVPMGRQYPQDVLCLDQEDDGTPCPFCQSEFKEIKARSTKGFYNVIWRGNQAFQQYNQQLVAYNAAQLQAGQPPALAYTLAPVYKRNAYGSPEKGADNNKIILGYDDGIFLWKASKTVHEQIVAKDGTYHGLTTRDFTVRRQGATKEDTAYFIEPMNVETGAQPMSAADQQLATKRYDLDKFITPMSYDEAVKVIAGGPIAGAPGPQPTFDRSMAGGFQPGLLQPGPTPFTQPPVGTASPLGTPQQ